jgi:hypothetical protein
MIEHPSTRRQREVLQQIDQKYGPRFRICGFDKAVRGVQIDHVHGGGGAIRFKSPRPGLGCHFRQRAVSCDKPGIQRFSKS